MYICSICAPRARTHVPPSSTRSTWVVDCGGVTAFCVDTGDVEDVVEETRAVSPRVVVDELLAGVARGLRQPARGVEDHRASRPERSRGCPGRSTALPSPARRCTGRSRTTPTSRSCPIPSAWRRARVRARHTTSAATRRARLAAAGSPKRNCSHGSMRLPRLREDVRRDAVSGCRERVVLLIEHGREHRHRRARGLEVGLRVHRPAVVDVLAGGPGELGDVLGLFAREGTSVHHVRPLAVFAAQTKPARLRTESGPYCQPSGHPPPASDLRVRRSGELRPEAARHVAPPPGRRPGSSLASAMPAAPFAKR